MHGWGRGRDTGNSQTQNLSWKGYANPVLTPANPKHTGKSWGLPVSGMLTTLCMPGTSHSRHNEDQPGWIAVLSHWPSKISLKSCDGGPQWPHCDGTSKVSTGLRTLAGPTVCLLSPGGPQGSGLRPLLGSRDRNTLQTGCLTDVCIPSKFMGQNPNSQCHCIWR